MRVHHIGFVAQSLGEARNHLGFPFGAPLEIVSDERQQNEIHIFGGVGNVEFVELLVPMGKKSTITGFISRFGPGFHHLAFRVPSLSEARTRVSTNPFNVVVGSFSLTIDSFGGEVSTLFVSQTGVLTEYLEVSS